MEPYLDILKDFDTFLVMSVEPGFGARISCPRCWAKSARSARWSIPAS
ncbi:ribulose-phosphate 3 epimerase family protein [Mycobacterium xenopi 4042]|uniref:Ribulose-phosphate 3 epimerase family protein n=1 Tax=Mycobacterium xenopi 4042 TaxID=1299334 RepID=X7YPI1_MYCXE|nr:ribulose-phosphate 3 epimerase family protein [Mycobacterium xenopi 4042]